MADQVAVWPGDSYPLGATYDGAGTNFALFSEVAERVELCLFDDDGKESRVDLREVDGFVWHGYLPGISPGQRYGYRVHGPYNPPAGQRCNPAKLLLDPYAKAIDGQVRLGPAGVLLLLREPGPAQQRRLRAARPALGGGQPVLRLGPDRPPRTPYHETVIYEAHVRGLTKQHPVVPESSAGPTSAWPTRRSSSTCSGWASPRSS